MSKQLLRTPLLGLAFLLAAISLSFWVNVGVGSNDLPAERSQIRITGGENHNITLADGARLTKNFRLSSSADALHAEMFGRDAILAILSQQECVGMRIYIGKKDNGSEVFVLVGVNSQGADITYGKVAETGWPCPPYCDGASELSTDIKPPL